MTTISDVAAWLMENGGVYIIIVLGLLLAAGAFFVNTPWGRKWYERRHPGPGQKPGVPWYERPYPPKKRSRP